MPLLCVNEFRELLYFLSFQPFNPALGSCFTTEILEGFDVQRTSGLADTLKKYGHLTQAILQYYKSVLPEDHSKCTGVCPPFDEFVKRCQDLDKMTVSDVFAIQLMQVWFASMWREYLSYENLAVIWANTLAASFLFFSFFFLFLFIYVCVCVWFFWGDKLHIQHLNTVINGFSEH